MIKSFSIFVIISLVVALLVWTRPDIQAELQPLPPTRVYTTPVEVMDIQPVTRITGKLQPVRKASLRFEVSGNVTRRLVEPGQTVKGGEILLQIEEGDFADSVDEVEAKLAQETKAINRDRNLLELIKKEREALERELRRLEQLGQESLSSKSNYDQALQRLLQRQADETRLQHSVETATARLKTVHAELNRAQRNLDRTRLIAPFAGTVNSVSVEVGDFATTGQVAIELVQLDSLDLYIEVTGSVANQLSLGQKVDVYTDDIQHHGTIVAIEADPDPETHTHALRIRMQTDGLFSGQLATAELPEQLLSNVLVVPVSSILRDENKAYVFKLEKNHVIRQPVILKQRHKQWQVIKGIEPNTEIISRDVATLASGQEVVVEQ